MKKYTQEILQNLPDQAHKTVIVTGSNTGLGYQIAFELARKKAHTIIACRDVQKGIDACDKMKSESGNSNIDVRQLDLADLSSIRKFIEVFNQKYN